ncbi:hypothetical protein A2U01_0109053, partial [Trifolium medium]|nr:hypothetical protein [Trifolium medium]
DAVFSPAEVVWWLGSGGLCCLVVRSEWCGGGG